MLKERKTQARVQKETIKQMKKTIPREEILSTLFSTIASLGLSAVSAFLAIKEGRAPWLVVLITFLSVLALIGVGLYLSSFRKIRKFQDDYNYYEASKNISTALLTAIKRIQFDKTSYILQSTYEKVPKWRPINYNENILVYDVHEHLRKICIRFKELVVSLAPGDFNDDKVTVDIAYRYPSEEKFKVFNTDTSCNASNSDSSSKTNFDTDQNEANTPKSPWKIITSGDHTSSHIVLQRFLESENSFYHYLQEKGYAFFNDKSTLADQNHYIWTTKDNEHNRIGSIAGSIIQLKNDLPDSTFLEVYLTITTYGRRFVEESDLLTEDKFQLLFKETVMNTYKTLIEEELAQMFIRHGIQKKYINPRTGLIKLKE